MLNSSKRILIFLLLSSILALSLAYLSQTFGYQPCILCFYQRKPFFVVIAVAILTLLFFKNFRAQKIAVLLCVILLTINAGIALYHVGVEQKIFRGPSTCSSQELNEINDLEKLKTALLSTKAIRCDEPQFFFLGLSMAAWNFIYCTTLVFIILLNNRLTHRN